MRQPRGLRINQPHSNNELRGLGCPSAPPHRPAPRQEGFLHARGKSNFASLGVCYSRALRPFRMAGSWRLEREGAPRVTPRVEARPAPPPGTLRANLGSYSRSARGSILEWAYSRQLQQFMDAGKSPGFLWAACLSDLDPLRPPFLARVTLIQDQGPPPVFRTGMSGRCPKLAPSPLHQESKFPSKFSEVWLEPVAMLHCSSSASLGLNAAALIEGLNRGAGVERRR